MRRRQWFVWHSCIGVTAGLLLFVICWSGTLAVFAYEIDWLLNPALRVTPKSEPQNWEKVRTAAEAAVPDGRITAINWPKGSHFAAEVWMERPGNKAWRVYVDPSSGAVTGTSSYFNVQRFFRSFHMNLFFSNLPFDYPYWGYLVVGIFGFVLIVSVITSLVFYRRWWRGFFKLKTDRGRRVFWSDWHKLTGLWGLWFALTIAITGIWYFVEILDVLPGSPEAPRLQAQHNTVSSPPSLDALLKQAREVWPQFNARFIGYPYEPGDALEIQGQDGSILVRDRANKIWFSTDDGAVIGTQSAADLTAFQRWIETADPLHFGNFGGLTTKLIWFVFGLALSAMALTGAYLQVKRQTLHGETTRRKMILISYCLTTAVLLASAVGSWIEIRNYGLIVNGVQTWPDVPMEVATFIGAWIALTLMILTIWMRKLK